MISVAVINSGLCNLDSIVRALQECGGSPWVTADPAKVAIADRVVLPGVGAFPAAAQRLNQSGLDDAIRKAALRGAPVLGICLGMQLLADISEEGGIRQGLGLIPGSVVRLTPTCQAERVPHVGWNTVRPQTNSPLLAGVKPETDFYFVHSYHFACADRAHVWATTPYCGELISVVGRDNVMGTQFHPEKSMRAGFRVLTNFLGL
jgi:glutamine amidotransferase